MSLRYCALIFGFIAAPAAAQLAPADTSRDPSGIARVSVLVLPGGALEDDLRSRVLGALDSAPPSLIRSATIRRRGKLPSYRGVTFTALAPISDFAWNSEIPFSMNDGSAWAGRGASVRITGGGALFVGPLTVVAAPEYTYAANGVSFVPTSPNQDRSEFASPWHSGTHSMDLPLRFGNGSLHMLSGGQSRIEVAYRSVAVGASTEDQWWGPGARNALVLSSNAPGIPHLYLATRNPVDVGIGTVEARWIAGWLTESIFFDEDASNDLRSLSGLVATLRLAGEPGLTVGVARAVYAPASRVGVVPARALDVLTRWQRTDDTTAAVADVPREQVLSLFGRWTFPASGLEVYGEWARQQPPTSLRDLLVAPQRTQGYTLGLQAVRPALGGAVRGHVELTMLEQPAQARMGEVASFYTSRLIPQGYSHRGQSLGAATGPGSSSQWIAFDYLANRWRAGVNFARIRWEQDTYFQQPTGFERHAHDVSLIAGLRAAVQLRGVRIDAELARMHRLNYLFQNQFGGYFQDDEFDVHNTTLRIGAAVTP